MGRSAKAQVLVVVVVMAIVVGVIALLPATDPILLAYAVYGFSLRTMILAAIGIVFAVILCYTALEMSLRASILLVAGTVIGFAVLVIVGWVLFVAFVLPGMPSSGGVPG